MAVGDGGAPVVVWAAGTETGEREKAKREGDTEGDRGNGGVAVAVRRRCGDGRWEGGVVVGDGWMWGGGRGR